MQIDSEKQRVPNRRCSRDPECCLQFVISGEIFEPLVAADADCGKIFIRTVRFRASLDDLNKGPLS